MAVFGFVHSGVNIAVNEVAKEIGVPTMGTQTGAGDVTGKHYPIAFRTHAVDPPRVATWMGWIKKNNWKRIAILAETTDYGIGLANETEKQAKAAGAGMEIQTIMFDRTTTDLLPQLLAGQGFQAGRDRQRRRRPAARADDPAGEHGRPACPTSRW